MEAQQPTRTFTPAQGAVAPVKKAWTGGFGGKPNVDRETAAERTLKQRAINRQSARRDAIDYLVAQGKPFTLDQVYLTAEALFNWVNK